MASRAELIDRAAPTRARASAATPKIRSRKDGAAVPLDDARPPAAEPDAGQLPDRAAPLPRTSPALAAVRRGAR